MFLSVGRLSFYPGTYKRNVRSLAKSPEFGGMRCLLICAVLTIVQIRVSLANWNEWWTYDGISGPLYWGVINKAWSLCTRGKFQSPINVDPTYLAFDPNLRSLHIDKYPVEGVVYNTGQSLVFKAEKGRGSKLPINITGGPLSYNYQFEKMLIHWGATESERHLDMERTSSRGSEHSIGGRFFPGEVQLFGFNSDLYKNLSEALGNPGGVVGVSLMIRETDRGGNEALKAIVHQVKKVTFKGQNQRVSKITFGDLIPSTEFYMTYEGSMTQPGCQEGLRWIILNKPIYLTRTHFENLRSLMQGDKTQPKSPLGPNNRPLQDLNFRAVSTNIAFDKFDPNLDYNEGENQNLFVKSKKKKKKKKNCPDIRKEMYYHANL